MFPGLWLNFQKKTSICPNPCMWISLIFSMRSITYYKLYYFVNLRLVISVPSRPKMKYVDAISVWRLTSDYKTITAFLLRPLLIWILLFCPCLFSPSLRCGLSGLVAFWMRSGDELHSSDDQPSWFWLYWVISLSLLSDDLINATLILYTFMLRLLISIHYVYWRRMLHSQPDTVAASKSWPRGSRRRLASARLC